MAQNAVPAQTANAAAASKPQGFWARTGRALQRANPFQRNRIAAHLSPAVDLTGFGQNIDDAKKQPRDKPFRRPNHAHQGRYAAPGFGLYGLRSLEDNTYGFGSFLSEIGKFNPLYISPFSQSLMRRSVFPRLALLILKASLQQRQYVVEGEDSRAEAFHQAWIDRLLPQVLRMAPNAIWYGWQPFVLDWSYDSADATWAPSRFNDVDIFSTEALRDPQTGAYVGLATEGGRFGSDRSFWLTWNEELGDPYGEPQSYTCYPYWWAASVTLVWMMRYYERSVDPVRIAFAKNISVFTGRINDDGTKEKIDLTELVAEAMDASAGGDSLAVPLGEDEEGKPVDLVRIDTLEMPDRADTWMTLINFLEQRQFLATLNLPGVGVMAGETKFAEARIAKDVQLAILEFASDMPLAALNDTLIPLVHELNGLPGKPPVVKGQAFKREREEAILEVFKAVLNETFPEIGEGGPTGKHFRMADLIRPEWLLRTLNIAGFEVGEVARDLEEIVASAGRPGGRPDEPLNTGDEQPSRAEDRQSGLER